VKDSAGEPVQGATVFVSQVSHGDDVAINDGDSNDIDYVDSDDGELSGRVGFVEEECDNKLKRRILATTYARRVHCGR